ncbi:MULTISPECIES: hypothetical protein [Streptacidiphilus]|uniref:PE-PGRS family protein n=1 Tax=Streptacidiphilus cavernicola TaxID=3342716 RepID=A0ABV6URQ2_9ACTN|nr:hypothetical protein [Streptacidiphilus jeojiense]
MVSRPPQWQQDANRDSQIVDPVVTIQELSRLRPLRSARIDYALVFTRPTGGFDAYLPPHRPNRTDVASRRWTTVYEVDMGLHTGSSSYALPSTNDAFLFEVTLDWTWQVRDPAAFVASGERDVPVLVQRNVDALIRPLLRRFGIEESGIAEREAQQRMLDIGRLTAAQGLAVSCALQIRRDEAAIAHEQQLRAIDYERQRLEPQHQLDLLADGLAAARALAAGRQEHDLAWQQQQLGHVLEVDRGRKGLELQEIEAKKIAFYTYYLERQGPAAMAFHLSQHPEDARLVMENLRADHLRTIQNKLDLALQALKGGPGGLEEHQLDEPRRLAAKAIRDILDERLAPTAGPGEPVRDAVEGAGTATPADEAGPASAAPADSEPTFGYRPQS